SEGMAAVGAGHLIALADAGIEGRQTGLCGHGRDAGGKQQRYTEQGRSHRSSAWSAPPANAAETSQVSAMTRRIPRIPQGKTRNETLTKHSPTISHSGTRGFANLVETRWTH